MNKRKNIPAPLKKELQQEIGSTCPFCSNRDVAGFEIHHIDENPANNDPTNLLMLCGTCHNLVTQGRITRVEVEKVKKNLVFTRHGIEFSLVTIEEDKCAWRKDPDHYAFYAVDTVKNGQSCFPILTWSVINHLPKTVILHDIRYQAMEYFSGLHGTPKASVLSPLISYKIPIKRDEQEHHVGLNRPIQIPTNGAFQFSTELYRPGEGKKHYSFWPREQCHIDFKFGFSGNIWLQAPRIFFNRKHEEDSLEIVGLS